MGFGDALMDSGAARRAQTTDPRKVRIIYANKVPWSEVWENNPRLARPGEEGDFQLLYRRAADKMWSYWNGKTEERYIYNLNFRADIGELYFSEAEKEFGSCYVGRIIVEPLIKAKASPNKRWPWVSWQRLASLARSNARLTQLGPEGTPQLEGVEFVATPSFRMACAVIARARAVVFHEGGCHHAAAALGVPGVVIFGGYIPIELTGYPVHRNLGGSLGDACGMRIPCEHCAAEMAKISPEQVFDELGRILNAKH